MDGSVDQDVRPSEGGWVDCGCGDRHWGAFGAAGLLVWRRARETGAGVEILMQLRAGWTHGGGTWGVPGGAVRAGESPAEAALRECEEETGLPARVLRLGAEHIQAHPDWSYTTFTAQAPCDEAWDKLVPLDRESLEMRWVRLSAPSALSGLSGLSAPSARRNGTTWERPVPGTDDVYGEAPLLPAFDAVWEELAVLLPAPSAEIGRSPARDRSGSHDIGGRDGRD